ncbi:MAG: FKBP-type peptidyl-prolyl cis-trans isomerase [Flavobacteriales bacterium]
MSAVKTNDQVKVHYTGRLTDGEVFDSSEGREPIAFTAGAGQMIKGFDDAVIGMELNEKKTINIPAAEAYGPVNEQLVHTVDRTQLPADMNPQVGERLMAGGPEGQEMQVVVTAVTDANITVDANHPLAGADLIFDVELVEIG